MNKINIIAEKNKNSETIDFLFLIYVILFCGLGLTTLYSGSTGYASRIFNDPLYFVKRQSIHLLVGFLLLFITLTINFEKLLKYLPIIFVGSIVLLVLPFVPGIGVTRNGASRWIKFGITTIQPSEISKIVIVLFLSNLFAKNHKEIQSDNGIVYRALFVTILFSLIIYMQNDFSTAIFVLVLAFLMFFISNVRINFFIQTFIVFLPFIALMILSKEYRVQRVISYLHPQNDPLGASYQVNAAIQALSESGLWGRGLGNGIRKIASIPEVQSDFIFAAWAEEMGFVGVLVYFMLLIMFAYRGYKISFNVKDRFYALFGFGCTSIIFLQSLINCGVVVRFFPATGIPLPFFSSGGSSLLITLILCGCILNVSKLKTKEQI